MVEFVHDGADEHADFLAKKYTGADKFVSPDGRQRVILRIRPERINMQP